MWLCQIYLWNNIECTQVCREHVQPISCWQDMVQNIVMLKYVWIGSEITQGVKGLYSTFCKAVMWIWWDIFFSLCNQYDIFFQRIKLMVVLLKIQHKTVCRSIGWITMKLLGDIHAWHHWPRVSSTTIMRFTPDVFMREALQSSWAHTLCCLDFDLMMLCFSNQS